MSVPAKGGLAGSAAVGCVVMIAGAMLIFSISEAGTFWAMLLLFAVAALLAALGHSMSQRMDPAGRYLARRQRLAGPPPGAELPG